ncbi:DUF6350 family protein, partial [Streptomyces bohaiensis]|uniref:cell division protein PerM n=1 Tax=Streptomyces bohaiensis TaxID=1431344 RepID=UPI0030C6EFA8
MSALFAATVAAVRSLPARLRSPRRSAESATTDPGAARAAPRAARPGARRPERRPHDESDDTAEFGGRRPGGACAAEGLVAAGLGAGALAVVVLALWTVSPHPDDGPGNATTLAVDLWLLAHGAGLVRADTLGGTPAPVTLTPLLLALVPGWLLRRAVRVALPADSGPGRALTTALWITGGYLAAAAAGVLYTLDGPIRVDPLSAAVAVPLFALVVTVTAGWSHTGPPLLPGRAQWLQETDAPRAAAAGLAAMCGAGTVLAAIALVGHAGAAQSLFGQLAGDWSGRISLLLLACALVPNAAVWAAAYGLGVGFTVGGGVWLAPLATGGDDPRLPPFPLLAALPGEGGAPLTLALAALVPLTAISVTAFFLGRAAVPVRADRTTATSAADTACAALLAAALLGLGTGVLALLAGGALGTGGLAEFGPAPWLTAAAAFGWVAVLGTPAALLARAWRLRREQFARSVVHDGADSARQLAARGGRAVARRVPRTRRRGEPDGQQGAGTGPAASAAPPRGLRTGGEDTPDAPPPGRPAFLVPSGPDRPGPGAVSTTGSVPADEDEAPTGRVRRGWTALGGAAARLRPRRRTERDTEREASGGDVAPPPPPPQPGELSGAGNGRIAWQGSGALPEELSLAAGARPVPLAGRNRATGQAGAPGGADGR